MGIEAFLFWVIAVSFGIAGLAGVEWLLTNWTPKMPPRKRERIPAREYELLGEDYRDAVEDWFHRREQREGSHRG